VLLPVGDLLVILLLLPLVLLLDPLALVLSGLFVVGLLSSAFAFPAFFSSGFSLRPASFLVGLGLGERFELGLGEDVELNSAMTNR
jgi:hypothetical protein